MPLINNDAIYNITQLVTGCTLLGSDAEGKTVQFDFTGIIDAIKADTDVIHYAIADKVGQTAVGNSDPNNKDSPNINNGYKWIGVLKAYPVVTDDDVDFIMQNIS